MFARHRQGPLTHRLGGNEAAHLDIGPLDVGAEAVGKEHRIGEEGQLQLSFFQAGLGFGHDNGVGGLDDVAARFDESQRRSLRPAEVARPMLPAVASTQPALCNDLRIAVSL